MNWIKHLNRKFQYTDDSLITIKAAEEAIGKILAIERKRWRMVQTAEGAIMVPLFELEEAFNLTQKKVEP